MCIHAGPDPGPQHCCELPRYTGGTEKRWLTITKRLNRDPHQRESRIEIGIKVHGSATLTLTQNFDPSMSTVKVGNIDLGR